MGKQLENLIRKLQIPQLKVLKLLCEGDQGVYSNQEISDTMSTASYTLGAVLAPLRRYKINGEPLIITAGVDSLEGTRWQLNERIIDRNELRYLLVKMEIS